jgi:hypothetical protein
MKKTFTLLTILFLCSGWAIAQTKARYQDPLRFDPNRKSIKLTDLVPQKSIAFFEDFTGANIPQGWQNIGTGTPGYSWEHAGVQFNFVFIDSDAYPGNNVAGRLITPPIDCSEMSTVILGMNHFYRHLTQSTAIIRVSSDGENFEDAFVFSGNVGDGSYPYQEYDISEYAAGRPIVYIEFFYDDGNSWAWYWDIDQLIVFEPTDAPSCAQTPTPADQADYVSLNPTLSWSPLPGGVVTGYNLYFGTTNPPPFLADAGSETSFAPGPLDFGTTYYWQVKPYNEGGEAEGCEVWSFTTGPEEILVSQFPFFTGFDSRAERWGWSGQASNAGDDARPWTFATSTNIGSVSPPVFVGVFYHEAFPKDEWLFSVPFYFEAGSTYEIKFYVRAPGWAGVAERLKLHVADEANAESMLSTPSVYDNNNQIIAAWTQMTAFFSPQESGEYFLGWHAYSPADLDYIAIDNVTIEVAPDCVTPADPTASGITANSAILSWTGTASTYNVEWGTTGFAQGTGTLVEGVSSPYLLEGLGQATAYQFYVQAVCNGDVSDWAGPVGFTTQLAVTPPYSQGFPTTTAPEGWTTTGWTIGTTVAIPPIDGNYIRRNLWSNTPTSSLTTVNIGEIEQGMVLSFVYALANFGSPYAPPAEGSGDFVVYVSTDYGVNYTEVETFENNAIAGWQAVQIDLDAFTGEIIKIRITGNRYDGDYFLAFDNFYVGIPPTCLTPSLLTATQVTTTTALLGWTPGGDETSWNIEWGPTGFEQGSGTLVAGVDNPYLLEGLEQATTYQFYVQAVCNGDLSEWAGPVGFTTQLAVPPPYSQGFPTTTIPDGWTTTGWIIGTTAAIPPIDGNYLRRNLYGTGANATGTFSTVNIGPIETGMVLSFDFNLANWSSPYAPPEVGTGDFVVYISTDFGINYTEVETMENNAIAGWQSYSTSLEAFAGEIIKIRIIGNRYDGDYFLAFDNFFVGIPPTCLIPSLLTATQVTTTTALLGWTPGGDETSWNIEWGPAGFEQGSGALVEGVDNPYLLEGLEQATAYQFYVQAVCNGDLSEWAGPVGFTTQLAVPPPYSQGFSTTTIPDGWTTTGWIIGTTAAIPPIDGNYLRRNLYGTGTNATGTFSTVNIGPIETGMVLSFDYNLANWSSPHASPAEGSGDFVVYVSTDYGVNYTEVETFMNNAIAGWQAVQIDLDAFAGEIIKIKITGNRYDGDYWLAFDNFFVGEATTEDIVIDLKVILEGAYSPAKDALMHTQLNQNGFLPLSQPYAPNLPYYGNNNPLWYYQGDESVTEMPVNVVDWVLVELRDAPLASQAYNNTVVARQAALLLNTGQIVNTEGELLVFDAEVQDNLFVVVYHRNHLAVMSAEALTEVDGIYSWDFTTAAEKAFTTADKAAYLAGHKLLPGGLFGMFGGDGDGNGQIQNQDKNAVWNPAAGLSGYLGGDFDLNAQVNNPDKNNIWNPNGGMGSAVPGNPPK